MPDYCIYHMPGSCSQVGLTAFEEIGVPYEDKGVDLMRGGHQQPAYLSLNPKAKVPTLVADGRVVTELPIILLHLAEQHPDAMLLPHDGSARLASLSDLVWISGALHGLVGRMFRPFVTSSADPEGVRAIAAADLARHAGLMAARLATGPWWHGAQWSVVDPLVAWLFGTAAQCGFPDAEFPPLAAHRDRVRKRPSYARAIARERQAVQRDDLALPPEGGR